MSKWLSVFILSIFTAGTLWLGLYLWQSDRDYRERGRAASVSSLVSVDQQTSTERSGRYGQRERTSRKILATMTYVDASGQTVQFQRLVSPEQLGRLQGKQPVTIEYIQGEWNSERFEDEAGGAVPWLAASAVFFVLLVHVIRRPAERAAGASQARPSSVSNGAAWMIRAALVVTSLGAIVGGGAGLAAGSGAGGDLVLLGVGVVLLGLFKLALRLKLA